MSKHPCRAAAAMLGSRRYRGGGFSMRRTLVAALLAAAVMALAAAPANATQIKIQVLSSQPNQVSGGDALISVTSKDDEYPLSSLHVKRNGWDVTNLFEEKDGALVGL